MPSCSSTDRINNSIEICLLFEKFNNGDEISDDGFCVNQSFDDGFCVNQSFDDGFCVNQCIDDGFCVSQNFDCGFCVNQIFDDEFYVNQIFDNTLNLPESNIYIPLTNNNLDSNPKLSIQSLQN